MAIIKKKVTTRWLDAEGKQVKPGTPGARKVQHESAKWYAFYLPGTPKGMTVPLSTRKDVAQRQLAELLAKAERGELGMADPVTEARDLLVKDLVAEFCEHLRSKGQTNAKQVALLESRLGATVEGCKWVRLRDLDAEEAATWLASRRGLKRQEGGISIQTSNHYRTHLRAWGRWLVRKQRLKANPFDELQPLNADMDRKHLRRDLDPEEVARLLQTTQNSTRIWRGMNGVDRAWLYLIASGTGLRANELGSLTPAHFDLDSDPPTVQVAKKRTKNKKGGLQPLPSILITPLRAWLAEMEPDAKLWPGKWQPKAALMLRKDLAACEPPIPYVVQGIDGPEHADLHSLRHTYVSMLSREAPLKVAQLAARHGSLQVTERYTHAHLGEIAKAVNALPLTYNGQQQEAALTVEQIAGLAILAWTVLGVLLPQNGQSQELGQELGSDLISN